MPKYSEHTRQFLRFIKLNQPPLYVQKQVIEENPELRRWLINYTEVHNEAYTQRAGSPARRSLLDWLSGYRVVGQDDPTNVKGRRDDAPNVVGSLQRRFEDLWK